MRDTRAMCRPISRRNDRNGSGRWHARHEPPLARKSARRCRGAGSLTRGSLVVRRFSIIRNRIILKETREEHRTARPPRASPAHRSPSAYYSLCGSIFDVPDRHLFHFDAFRRLLPDRLFSSLPPGSTSLPVSLWLCTGTPQCRAPSSNTSISSSASSLNGPLYTHGLWGSTDPPI